MIACRINNVRGYTHGESVKKWFRRNTFQIHTKFFCVCVIITVGNQSIWADRFVATTQNRVWVASKSYPSRNQIWDKWQGNERECKMNSSGMRWQQRQTIIMLPLRTEHHTLLAKVMVRFFLCYFEPLLSRQSRTENVRTA